MKIATSSVVDAEFAPLPEGWYTATIHNIAQAVTGPRSKNPGEPQLSVTFKVTEDGDFKNRRLFAYYTLVPDTDEHKGMAFTKRFLAGIGIDTSLDVDFEPKQHIGQEVELMVEQQVWNDSMSNRVTEVQSALAVSLAA